MKKALALILSLVMILALCACGSSNSSSNDNNDNNAQSEVQTEAVTTAQEGVLIMATNAAFPPYEFVSDEDGETIVGIDAEIAALIAEKLGLELQIEDMEFASIITAVQTNKVDIGMAGMTVNEDRLQNVNFTTPYATGVQVIIVREGSDITSPEDLAGEDIMIGVQEATTGHIYCEDEFGTDHVTAYSNGATAVQALLSDKVDCVVIDNEPAKAFVAANEGLTILETAYTVEDYAIAVSKDNDALLNAVNTALEELIADGTVQSIIDKYISAE